MDLSFFTVFYFSTKYLIMLQLGKFADQGPHANCTSYSISSTDRSSTKLLGFRKQQRKPSLDNLHILFANITERYSRNTNICQLCSLIFHKIYQGRNNNNNVSSSSTHCVANKRQSLICKGFAKSPRQIYELIDLLYKICRIASL